MSPVGLQGETWQAVIKGHELDPMAQQQDQQRLMLERFQREVGYHETLHSNQQRRSAACSFPVPVLLSASHAVCIGVCQGVSMNAVG